MSIASRIESIEEHIGDIYDTLELGGSDLTNTDKNIVNINSELMGRYKDYLANGTDSLWNNWDNTTAEGTDLTLNNTIQAKMKIKPQGNTEQATTTGANILKMSDYTRTDFGVDIVCKNNLIEFNGTQSGTPDGARYASLLSNHTGNYPNYDVSPDYLTLPAGTYTANFIYINGTANDYIPKLSFVAGNTNPKTVLLQIPVNQAGTFTLQEETIVRVNVAFKGMMNNYKCRVTLTNTSTATDELYTYGASPNPLYPQTVNNVTGDVEVNVQNRNLDNGTTTDLYCTGSGQNRTVASRGDTKPGKIIKVKPNTAYVITGDFSDFGDSNLRVALFNDMPVVGSISTAHYNSSTKITFTTGANTHYILLYNTYNRVFNAPNLMIVEGTTESPYIPHQEQNYPISLGDIELCKIGNYQDYIYKENGNWYKYEAIGKTLINDILNFSKASNGLFYATNSIYNKDNILLSNILTYKSTAWQGSGTYNTTTWTDSGAFDTVPTDLRPKQYVYSTLGDTRMTVRVNYSTGKLQYVANGTISNPYFQCVMTWYLP